MEVLALREGKGEIFLTPDAFDNDWFRLFRQSKMHTFFLHCRLQCTGAPTRSSSLRLRGRNVKCYRSSLLLPRSGCCSTAFSPCGRECVGRWSEKTSALAPCPFRSRRLRIFFGQFSYVAHFLISIRAHDVFFPKDIFLSVCMSEKCMLLQWFGAGSEARRRWLHRFYGCGVLLAATGAVVVSGLLVHGTVTHLVWGCRVLHAFLRPERIAAAADSLDPELTVGGQLKNEPPSHGSIEPPSSPFTVAIPGVTIPWSDTPLFLVALCSALAFHELGMCPLSLYFS